MKRWHLVVVILLLLAAALWAKERYGRSQAEERARIAITAYELLSKQKDKLEVVYKTDTLRLTKWRTRWDSILVARTETLTVERVIYIADSTIKACEAVVATCEQRVAVVTEMADSARSAAKQWEKIAKGPFFRPAVEGTLSLDMDWQAAGEITLGRGAFKALARVDVGPGAETCAFLPRHQAYSCSTPTDAVVRLGARYAF